MPPFEQSSQAPLYGAFTPAYGLRRRATVVAFTATAVPGLTRFDLTWLGSISQRHTLG